MERLNYNHLFYFYVVAKEGSIKVASEKLHVTQPTISDQLKLLEEYFGSSLFERKNRGLYLNRDGRVALEYAEKIFSLGQELTSRLRNNIELPKKSLDIGIGTSLAHYFFYDKLMPLFDQSDVAINVHENDRGYLLVDLEEGNIDVLFTDSREPLSPSMIAYKIGTSKTFVVGHKNFKKYKRQFPQSLTEIPFFNYTDEAFLRYEIELFFARESITPQIIGEADDPDLLQLVTEQGKAFTIVPEAIKNRFCQNPDVIVLGEIKELQSAVWGVIKKSSTGLGDKLLKSMNS